MSTHEKDREGAPQELDELAPAILGVPGQPSHVCDYVRFQHYRQGFLARWT